MFVWPFVLRSGPQREVSVCSKVSGYLGSCTGSFEDPAKQVWVPLHLLPRGGNDGSEVWPGAALGSHIQLSVSQFIHLQSGA